MIGDFAEYQPITIKDLGVELPEAPFYPDFYVLSQCDVLAISNSTFSFAAAMLNERGKFFFRPHLLQEKLIAFDPWNSEPLLRDNPNDLGLKVLQNPVKIIHIQEVALMPLDDPELLWGFNIEAPTIGTKVSASSILIGGWVLGKKSRAIKVELIRNGEVIHEIPVSQHRPDVAAVFSGVPLAENSGYAIDWEIAVTPPESQLFLQAVLADDTRVKMGSIRLQEVVYPTPKLKPRKKCKLSLCAIMKDEAPYLIEWLEFHKIVGVERFYLYNNNSTDNTLDIVQSYVQSGEVVLHDWPFSPKQQASAYEHCLEAYRQESEWITFLDLDEFLFPTEKENLIEVLEEFDSVPAVGVNTLIFGSSGHETRREGLQIENFTQRSQDDFESNRYIKSIVRPEQILRPNCPHFFVPINNESFTVTENKEPLTSSISQRLSVQKMRVNHYYTRSKQEMKQKVMRGDAFFSWGKALSVLEAWDRNEVEDLTIQRFVPKLRQAVDSVKSQSRIAQILTEHWSLQSKLYQMQIEFEESHKKLHQTPGGFEQFTTQIQQVQEELQPIKEELEIRRVQYHKNQEELEQTKSQLIEVQTQLQDMESAAVPLSQLAELYLSQGKLEDAIAICEQSLKIQPKSAPILKVMGNICQAKGQLDEAKSWYVKAIELQPDFAQALANLGTIHAQQQQWPLAIASYQKAIAIQPNFAGVYRNLARVFSQIGKSEEATECWYAAVVLEPEITAEEYLNLGNTLFEQGKQERAIICYRRAVYLNPSFAEANDKLTEVIAVVGE